MCRTSELTLFHCFLHTLHVTLLAAAARLFGDIFSALAALVPASTAAEMLDATAFDAAAAFDVDAMLVATAGDTFCTGVLLRLTNVCGAAARIGDDTGDAVTSAVPLSAMLLLLTSGSISAARLCVFRCMASGPLRVNRRSQWAHGNGPPIDDPLRDDAL